MRSIIRGNRPEPEAKRFLYEERITLRECADLEGAPERGEPEARTCAREDGAECLDLFQAYGLPEEVAADGVGVFSLLRESDLPPKEYLDAGFDTGHEHQRHS